MPPERTGAPRQDPVSCQSCRQRKLKCNRQVPCANCQARNVRCIYKSAEAALAHDQPAPTQNLAEISKENAEIKDRLNRIEQLLTSRHDATNIGITTPATPEHVYSRPVSLDGRGEYDSQPPEPGSSRIHIVDIPELARSLPVPKVESARIAVPPLDRALKLYDNFVSVVYPVHAVVFPPVLKKKIQTLYSNKALSLASKNEDIAFVLICLAQVVFYCHLEGDCLDFKSAAGGAQAVLTRWATIAIDLVWPPRGGTQVCLETVQVIIQYYFMLHHMEGIQPRILILHSDAVTMARMLGLHMIDLHVHKDQTRQAAVDREIGRRIWWQLCATEWQMASLPGSYEGIYTIHLSQMAVNMPRNLTDDDILYKNDSFSRPSSEVTSSSYMLQRIRMGEVCRKAVDVLYKGPRSFQVWEQQYENILFVDGLFEKMLGEMPQFLRLRADGKPESEPAIANNPTVELIRTVANVMLWTRRMKLHLPYIDLAAQDERYAFSGQMCLQSAKLLLIMRDMLRQSSSKDPVTNSRHLSMMKHMLRGVVAMLMGIYTDAEKPGPPSMSDPASASGDMENYERRANTFMDSIKTLVDEHEALITPAASTGLEPMDVGTRNTNTYADMSGQVNMGDWSNGMMPDFDFDFTWEQLLN